MPNEGQEVMGWTPISIPGKHTGKTFPQVIFSDPDWFFDAISKGMFGDDSQLSKEAREVFRRACHIRIPQREGENKVAVYIIHKPSRTFQEMRIVDRERAAEIAGTRMDVIDLSFPKTISNYDKFGYRTLIKNLKFYFFGYDSYRMTKKRCEEFFEDDRNFVL